MAVRNDCGLNSRAKFTTFGVLVGSFVHSSKCSYRSFTSANHEPKGRHDAKET